MIYQLEVINQDESLVIFEQYNNINDLKITYNELTTTLSNRKSLRGKTIQVFKGDNLENLQEIESYRMTF